MKRDCSKREMNYFRACFSEGNDLICIFDDFPITACPVLFVHY